MVKKEIKNYQFNRREILIDNKMRHLYNNNFSSPTNGTNEYQGKVKCKLAHSRGYSLIIPEIVIAFDDTKFIQPLFFSPNSIIKISNDDIRCDLFIDISFGCKIKVSFEAKNVLKKYTDGSEIFSCVIYGPVDLFKYCTGNIIPEHDEYYAVLFHHTSPKAKKAINVSQTYRASSWNFQGNRGLTNVEYIYFTCLNCIQNDDDLIMIAMSSKGNLQLILDGGSAENPRDIVSINVYRENSINRTSTIKTLVNIGDIASPHLLRHIDLPVYFEVMNPFIYRVGVKPKSMVKFDGKNLLPQSGQIQKFDYVVIGDGDDPEGIIAPFEEENTDKILKTENCKDFRCMLDFWFHHKNEDLYSGKNIDLQKFE